MEYYREGARSRTTGDGRKHALDMGEAKIAESANASRRKGASG
jgi:hypothetical protein